MPPHSHHPGVPGHGTKTPVKAYLASRGRRPYAMQLHPCMFVHVTLRDSFVLSFASSFFFLFSRCSRLCCICRDVDEESGLSSPLSRLGRFGGMCCWTIILTAGLSEAQVQKPGTSFGTRYLAVGHALYMQVPLDSEPQMIMMMMMMKRTQDYKHSRTMRLGSTHPFSSLLVIISRSQGLAAAGFACM